MKSQQNRILSRLPHKLAEKLMPFQREGVEFAVNKNGKCLIADEMGLGKTIQAIAVACYYRQEWPLLIIVPSSLRYCWIEEFEKWLPEINPEDINLIQSGCDASGIGSARVTIATFGLLSKSTSNIVREALLAKAFQVVIVDESHYIRNIKTVSAKTVVPLVKNAKRRILLSGTPALARPVELYPQIDAISPDTFGSWYAYTTRYCDAKLEWFGKMKRRNVNGASNLQELQHKLSSTLMIRREKDAVLTQLPPKQRQKILFELKQSELTKEIRKTFEELRPLLKKGSNEKFEVLTGAGDDLKDTNTLSMIQKLYQLSGEAKIGPAKEYIEMLCENPKLKFLVFAYHRSMMNGLSQSLYDRKIKFIRIDGETPPSERPQLVHQFQSDPDTRVAVLSILAAGVGLTFTAATVVVFAEMYWTPGVMVQCEDRAHRIGQSSCVAVHYLVAKDTMDEWVWSAVCKKTIVTSTTLTGKKKAMKADDGDQYQVDVLSSAEAWFPKETSDLDLSTYFQTHQDTDQKSILDFFTKGSGINAQTPPTRSMSQSSQKLKAADQASSQDSSMASNQLDSPPGIQRYLGEQSGNPCKRIRMDPSDQSTPTSVGNCSSVVVINSDTDDDFVELSQSAKSSSKSLNKKRKRKDSIESKSKSRLLSMWAKLDEENECVEITDNSDKIKSYELDTSKCLEKEVRKSEQDKIDDSTVSTPVRKNQTESHDSVGQWQCMACTYLNHKDLKYCEICETPKKVKTNNVELDKDSRARTLDGGCLMEIKSTASECRRLISETNNTDNHSDECSSQTDRSSECLLRKQNNDTDSSKSQRTGSDDKDDTDRIKECVFNTPKVSRSDRAQETTPTSSLKKYRFKSTRRSDSGSASPGLGNPGVQKKACVQDDDSLTRGNRLMADCSKSQDSLLETGNIGSNQDEQVPSSNEDKRVVNLDDIPIHAIFKYQCSKYTGRVFLFNEEEEPLHINFVPIDVEVGNLDDLPDLLLQPSNLRLVQKFVREWQSLTETKRRLLIKACRVFVSPIWEYDELKSCKTVNTQRHQTKIDSAMTAQKVANEVNGFVRVISRSSGVKEGSDQGTNQSSQEGVAQAVAADGTPLCLQCFKPYTNDLLQKSSISSKENAWQTRFCSQKCSQAYWTVTNNDYNRDKVYEAERGICQLCKFDAHSLYRQIRDTQDLQKRAELIAKSKFNNLPVKTKQQMTKKPLTGQFWHVDHIVPVWEGGGQCDIDNLRTLCVICHHKITAKQASKRAIVRKLGTAVSSGGITAFFQRS